MTQFHGKTLWNVSRRTLYKTFHLSPLLIGVVPWRKQRLPRCEVHAGGRLVN